MQVNTRWSEEEDSHNNIQTLSMAKDDQAAYLLKPYSQKYYF